MTFTATPGRVTGFLGLNGSAKTTTMRMLLGVARPTSDEALINGQRYRDLAQPLRQVGAVMEQGLSHPGQSGYSHLVTQALLAGVPRRRVEELLRRAGTPVAKVIPLYRRSTESVEAPSPANSSWPTTGTHPR